jgi:hypothetical protein
MEAWKETYFIKELSNKNKPNCFNLVGELLVNFDLPLVTLILFPTLIFLRPHFYSAPQIFSVLSNFTKD